LAQFYRSRLPGAHEKGGLTYLHGFELNRALDAAALFAAKRGVISPVSSSSVFLTDTRNVPPTGPCSGFASLKATGSSPAEACIDVLHKYSKASSEFFA
jgi:hypothetical protein